MSWNMSYSVIESTTSVPKTPMADTTNNDTSSVATVVIALIAILVIVALGIFALRSGGLGGTVTPGDDTDINIDLPGTDGGTTGGITGGVNP